MTTAANTTVTESTSTTPESRTANGRFAKGNRGGPGNPFARQTARLRQALVDAVTPEDIKAITDSLKQKAAAGDVAAAKLLFSYCVGKDDPDTLDQHELKIMVANHLDSTAGPLHVLSGMPLDVLLEIFRLIMPILRSDKVKLAKQILCAPLTAEEIEDSKGDEEAADEPSAVPAGDPCASIPEWMQNVVSPTRKQGTDTPPAEAEPDAELLRVLLERARNLPGTQPFAEDTSPATDGAEILKPSNGRQPPSANGSNGGKGTEPRKRPPSTNGVHA